MYTTCPKCRYVREPTDECSEDQCPKCGIIFSKWLHSQLRSLPAVDTAPDFAERFEGGVAGTYRWLRSRLFYIEPDVDGLTVYGRIAALVVAVLWGFRFILSDFTTLDGGFPVAGDPITHGVNLAFHEAGHILFIPLGDFMSALGGSLSQLLMPVVVMCAFLFKYKNPFGASIGLWWLGQSALDLVPYIDDARAQQLILLGGVTGRDVPGYHDWSYLLGRTGLLEFDHLIAGAVSFSGKTLMLLAMVWGAWLVWRQWQSIRR